MKFNKKFLLLSAMVFTSTTVAPYAFANQPISAIISDASNNKVKQEEEKNLYTNFQGKIIDIIKNDDNNLVRVQNGESIIDFIVNDNMDILFLNSKGEIVKNQLKKGQDIVVSYKTMQITTMIYPAQYRPSVIMTNDSKNQMYNLKVDKFKLDKKTNKYISNDNDLLITVDKKTSIINEKNKKISEKIDEKDVVVLYDIATMSIPAQTTPKKIIVLNDNSKSKDVKISKIENDQKNNKNMSLSIKNETSKSGKN